MVHANRVIAHLIACEAHKVEMLVPLRVVVIEASTKLLVVNKLADVLNDKLAPASPVRCVLSSVLWRTKPRVLHPLGDSTHSGLFPPDTFKIGSPVTNTRQLGRLPRCSTYALIGASVRMPLPFSSVWKTSRLHLDPCGTCAREQRAPSVSGQRVMHGRAWGLGCNRR